MIITYDYWETKQLWYVDMFLIPNDIRKVKYIQNVR
jgi:hypothetical protein